MNLTDYLDIQNRFAPDQGKLTGEKNERHEQVAIGLGFAERQAQKKPEKPANPENKPSLLYPWQY